MGHKNRHFDSLCENYSEIAHVAGLDPPAREHRVMAKRIIPCSDVPRRKSLWRHLDGLIAQGGRRQGPQKEIFREANQGNGPHSRSDGMLDIT
ncbi:hypothetical protein CEXT_282691 [Caerostris extrusa]|uniref:Uncharacterized protein n=1 Tax=Caerostris extrusa TaxID=172846 RepID=A0AAV4WCD1_CAEEX|nr:hypothetical protein CEXT_282691 [Caerostris extrusa]